MITTPFGIHSRFSDVDISAQFLTPIDGWQTAKEVSIMQAISPLDIPFSTSAVNCAVEFAEDLINSRDDFHMLTIDELAAINLYTQEAIYKILNAALRDRNRSTIKPWFPYLKLIIPGLQKLKPFRGQVWRGLKEVDLSSNYPIGKKFRWWSFTSTTKSGPSVEKFVGNTGIRTLVCIDSVSGVEIDELSAYREEGEVLFVPGTRFEVKTVFKPAEGLTIISLSEIPDSVTAVTEHTIPQTIQLPTTTPNEIIPKTATSIPPTQITIPTKTPKFTIPQTTVLLGSRTPRESETTMILPRSSTTPRESEPTVILPRFSTTPRSPRPQISTNPQTTPLPTTPKNNFIPHNPVPLHNYKVTPQTHPQSNPQPIPIPNLSGEWEIKDRKGGYLFSYTFTHVANHTEFTGVQTQTQFRSKNHKVNEPITGRVSKPNQSNKVNIEWRFDNSDVLCTAVLDLDTMKMIEGNYYKNSNLKGNFSAKKKK